MSNQPFEPKSLNIEALFTDSDARYQIPPYQRHYKWTDDEVDQLWTDLEESQNQNPNGNYFLGSIITAEPEKKTRYVDVVDGQQRLTTLIILFCVIRDLYPTINEDSKDEYAINLTTIQRAITAENDGTERLRMQQRLYPDDSAITDFIENIITEGATKKLEPQKPSDIKSDKPKYKYINTALNFRKKLMNLGKDGKGKVEVFVNYLFNKVQVIRINCKDITFAVKLFQVINTRGLDLAPSDLIKSFLLQEITAYFPKDELEHPIRQFIFDWAAVENMAKDCETDMDDLLNIYLYYILANNPPKSLFEELSKQIKDQIKSHNKTPTDVFGDIKRFAENYKNEIYNQDDKVIYSFWYLPWQTHWKSILLTALHVEYHDYAKLAEVLRRFYYLHWTAGKTLTRVKQTSFNIIKKVKDKEPIENIIKMLQEKIEKEKIVNETIEAFKGEKIADEKWCKPILLLLEYEAADNSKLAFVEWTKKLHLEHILPDGYTPRKEWGHISNSVADEYLDSAGNLTLLCGSKNIRASNKPFREKIKAYKGTGLEGDKQGITSFAITQKIVSDYETSAYGRKWSKDAMRDRKKWFLEEISKLLEIEEEMATSGFD